MVLLWVVLLVGSLAVEAMATAFFAMFVAIGCGVGAVSAAAGAPPWLQVMLAGVATVVGVIGLRPVLLGLVGRPHALPGVSDLVGQMAITVDSVGDEHHPGHALLAGERYLAITDSATLTVNATDCLPPRTPVTITEVRGTTLVVRPDATALIGGPSVL